MELSEMIVATAIQRHWDMRMPVDHEGLELILTNAADLQFWADHLIAAMNKVGEINS